MRKLDFIIIGAHKSGNTTLFQHLRYHPQVFLPPEKEVAFFSNEQFFAQGWERFFSEFFSNARPEQLLLGAAEITAQKQDQVPSGRVRS